MNEKQKARWERQRTLGMGRFVLRTGVLYWGGTMFLATLIIAYFMPSGNFDARHVIVRAVSCLAGGVFFGVLVWWNNERNYAKRS